MNKIVICPDSFKGSLSAVEVTDIIAEEILKVFPLCEVIKMPIADGGEGSLDTIISSIPSKVIKLKVEGADQIYREARYAITKDNIGIIELAEACGITKQVELNPLTSNTFGFGQLIKDALDRGIRKFILCIGGSASTDAGCGMAMALGAKFYDENHEEIRACGKTLSEIKEIDLSLLHEAIKESNFTIMCDVNNPLFGENGAAYVYGPQKGATKEDVEFLDEGLKNFNKLVGHISEHDFSQIEGSGAAGGLGAGCMFFLNGKLQSGIETILELNHFDEVVKDVDYIITGEGKVDYQSLKGKVLTGILSHSKEKNVSVVCGVNALSKEEIEDNNLSVYQLAEGITVNETIANPRYHLIKTIHRLLTEKQKEL